MEPVLRPRCQGGRASPEAVAAPARARTCADLRSELRRVVAPLHYAPRPV